MVSEERSHSGVRSIGFKPLPSSGTWGKSFSKPWLSNP